MTFREWLLPVSAFDTREGPFRGIGQAQSTEGRTSQRVSTRGLLRVVPVSVGIGSIEQPTRKSRCEPCSGLGKDVEGELRSEVTQLLRIDWVGGRCGN